MAIEELIASIKTEEATYLTDGGWNGHFAIHCECGDITAGSHLEEGNEDSTERLVNYYPKDISQRKRHTFYILSPLFVDVLYKNHRDVVGQQPIVIVCNSCSRKLGFTFESYLPLQVKLIDEYERLEKAKKGGDGS